MFSAMVYLVIMYVNVYVVENSKEWPPGQFVVARMCRLCLNPVNVQIKTVSGTSFDCQVKK